MPLQDIMRERTGGGTQAAARAARQQKAGTPPPAGGISAAQKVSGTAVGPPPQTPPAPARGPGGQPPAGGPGLSSPTMQGALSAARSGPPTAPTPEAINHGAGATLQFDPGQVLDFLGGMGDHLSGVMDQVGQHAEDQRASYYAENPEARDEQGNIITPEVDTGEGVARDETPIGEMTLEQVEAALAGIETTELPGNEPKWKRDKGDEYLAGIYQMDRIGPDAVAEHWPAILDAIMSGHNPGGKINDHELQSLREAAGRGEWDAVTSFVNKYFEEDDWFDPSGQGARNWDRNPQVKSGTMWNMNVDPRFGMDSAAVDHADLAWGELSENVTSNGRKKEDLLNRKAELGVEETKEEENLFWEEYIVPGMEQVDEWISGLPGMVEDWYTAGQEQMDRGHARDRLADAARRARLGMGGAGAQQDAVRAMSEDHAFQQRQLLGQKGQMELSAMMSGINSKLQQLGSYYTMNKDRMSDQHRREVEQQLIQLRTEGTRIGQALSSQMMTQQGMQNRENAQLQWAMQNPYQENPWLADLAQIGGNILTTGAGALITGLTAGAGAPIGLPMMASGGMGLVNAGMNATQPGTSAPWNPTYDDIPEFGNVTEKNPWGPGYNPWA